ncbi:MAG: hypothetical protein WHX52_02160 [Anaerolineae bacterium]
MTNKHVNDTLASTYNTGLARFPSWETVIDWMRAAGFEEDGAEAATAGITLTFPTELIMEMACGTKRYFVSRFSRSSRFFRS